MYRSGTEEEYTALQQLLEDIIMYTKDIAAAKEVLRGISKKKDEEDKKKGEEMRKAAMEGQTSTNISWFLFKNLYNAFAKIAFMFCDQFEKEKVFEFLEFNIVHIGR